MLVSQQEAGLDPAWATGLAVLDRLDNLESNVDSVSRVANKAKVHDLLCSGRPTFDTHTRWCKVLS